MIQSQGYRGYLSSRPFWGERVPQHVQNLVIRNYCMDNNLRFLLSSVEVVMPNTYMILENLLEQLDDIEGIVCYSMFQLHHEKHLRMKVYSTILSKCKSLHFAVEGLSLSSHQDVVRIDNILCVKNVMSNALGVEALRQGIKVAAATRTMK